MEKLGHLLVKLERLSEHYLDNIKIMKYLYTIILLVYCFILTGCNKSNPHLINVNQDYKRFKSKFESNFTDHFPQEIMSVENYLICNTNVKENEVGLILAETNVAETTIDSISKIIKSNHIDSYSNKDTCLLKINSNVKYNDSCNSQNKPIPDLENLDGIKSFLGNTFEVYVIEAKSGMFSENFKLKPSLKMPEKWVNGYSKGYALDKEKKTIIYWFLMW